jgi:hypothetical protein
VAFHVQLRDGRDSVRAFNLSEDEVRTKFIAPLRAGVMFTFQDKDFEPRKAQLMVIEGEHLGLGELGIGGVGWANVAKRGTDVTQRFLTASGGSQSSSLTMESAGRLKERMLGRLAAGPLALGDGVALTTDLLPGRRVSERLSAVETAVWEMLHAGAIALYTQAGAELVAQDQWESVVLDPFTWLAPGPDSPVIIATA